MWAILIVIITFSGDAVTQTITFDNYYSCGKSQMMLSKMEGDYVKSVVVSDCMRTNG